MPRALSALLFATFVAGGALPANARSNPAAATAVGPLGSKAEPTAPAIKPGTPVNDKSGNPVGLVETLIETPSGDLNVVVKIDGKLVGLNPSTLQLIGGREVSSQTKQEMLTSAGVPR